ncbi:MAG: endonuclease [Flavobacteriaceae bacterium]|jgi:endonuclease I|nr:endonuclease [Flavobacteriaceae bacterium]
MKRILLSLLFVPFLGLSQIPAGYYDETENLTGYALKSKLHEIISSNNFNWNYGDLPDFYNQTDIDKYYDKDGTLLDIYSENPYGPDAYEYTTDNLIGSASAEGQGWNREHMMPQSTFYSNYPMYSDLFYVIPTDARINQLRSNYPYGISSTSTVYYNFTNGSKIGQNATPNAPYTGRVYEPIDEFKGDIARSLLYFSVRYEGKLGTFKYDTDTNVTKDRNPLNGTEEKAFDDWFIDMLRQWNVSDPVSQREIDRNNEVYAIQKNRNPFIDHPEWIDLIWSETGDNIAPQAPVNLSVQKENAYFATLTWMPSSDTDILGYRIYENGVLVATTKSTNLAIDHLTPSTSYSFTVRAYDNSFLESPDSNSVSVATLSSDNYAKDLIISKYLEGTSNNKAVEIINKTGHDINLSNYRMNIQYKSSSTYYFSAPYELEGTIPDNTVFVVINPRANFSCYSVDKAKFVTAAPQLAFTGTQYIELSYKTQTVDAVGVYGASNSLANISLYRLPSVNQPNRAYDSSEWETHESNYCQDLGTLALPEIALPTEENVVILYPNPVSDLLFVKGNISKTAAATVFDILGNLMKTELSPFKNKNYINVEGLYSGTYILKLDNRSFKFIKK